MKLNNYFSTLIPSTFWPISSRSFLHLFALVSSGVFSLTNYDGSDRDLHDCRDARPYKSRTFYLTCQKCTALNDGLLDGAGGWKCHCSFLIGRLDFCGNRDA